MPESLFKGTVQRDFFILFFFIKRLPWSQETSLEAISELRQIFVELFVVEILKIDSLLSLTAGMSHRQPIFCYTFLTFPGEHYLQAQMIFCFNIPFKAGGVLQNL
jgi:hypothetical protein